MRFGRGSGLGAIVAILLALAGVAHAQEDVRIDLAEFGVGSAVRPGGMTGIRVELTSSVAGAVFNAIVQWEIEDADGDTVLYARTVALSPGQTKPVWLYGTLLPSPNTNANSRWMIRVFRETSDGRRGEEIGRRSIGINATGGTAAQWVDDDMSMIGVIGNADGGRNRVGLRELENPDSSLTRHPAANETPRIIRGLNARELPDRWFGLSPYDVIVWSADQINLSDESELALRSYIQRGGHLVIVLPENVSPWGLGVSSVNDSTPQLRAVLPNRTPRRDTIAIADLLPVLSKTDAARENFAMSVSVFADLADDPAATMGNEYEPLIVLPDRRVVAIRRTYGHGWITVLGIDIASGRLLSQQIVDGDVLWNRILGRRSDSPRPTELQAMKSAALKGVYTGRPSAEVSLTPPSLLENWTSKSQEAGRALLLAVLLFFLYWIAAGPGGFALLRQYKQARHAWLVFVAAAGVFTAITWGSVGLLRQRYTEIGHVTFLDHIAQPPGRERLDEPQYQRIMSWFSAFLPSYGATPIALDGPADERSNQVLHAFNPPRRLIDRFPNSDRYRVDIARTPASFDVPSRATAKMFEAEWLGAVDTAWGGMIRVDPADPLHIVNDGTSVGRLAGTLTHDLPGTLTNIQVFYVSANRTPPRRYQRSGEAILPYLPTSDQGELPNVGRMWSLANEYATWTPGIALDLGSVLGRPTAQNDLRLGIDKRYVDTYRGRAADGSLDQLTRAAARDYLEMLSIYQMLTPPAYFQTQNQTLSPVRFSRDTARRLDLSTWFSTPCVIVIAYLENSASPLPVLIDGRPPVRNEGLTIVRWIYPLPVDPEVAFTRAETENAG